MLYRSLITALITLLSFSQQAAYADQNNINLSGLTGQPPIQLWARAFWSGTADKPSGLAIELMEPLKAKLPQYQHRYQLMSLSRAFKDLNQRDDLCVLAVARSAERDQVGYFVGLWPVLPPKVVIRRADWQRINSSQPSISLQSLLQRTNLRSASIRHRTFGKTIDTWLKTAASEGRLQFLQTSNKDNNLLNMLARGRIDFTVDYLESFIGSTQSQPQLREELQLLAIDEMQQPVITGIYCPRTAHGEQLIRQIEQLAREPEINAQFQKIIAAYIPAQHRRPYQQWLDDFYQQRPQRNLSSLPN